MAIDKDLQGYLSHKKERPHRALQWDYAYGPVVVLGGGAVSYQQGTPVHEALIRAAFSARWGEDVEWCTSLKAFSAHHRALNHVE